MGLNVLVLSSCLSIGKNFGRGTFVRVHSKALLDYCRVKVVSPKPWVLGILFKGHLDYGVPNYEKRDGLEIFCPKYLSLPKCSLFKALMMFIFAFPTMLGLRKRFGFDLIHAHHIWPDGFLAVFFGRIFGKPVVITSHNPLLLRYLNQPIVSRIIRYVVRQADCIIAVSISQKKKILVFDSSVEKKIKVIPNGVDLSDFKPMASGFTRKKIGFNVGSSAITFVGRLDPVKGVSYLLEAIKKLDESGLKINLLVVGEGCELANLKKLTLDLGLSEKVFFAGARPHNEIALWMNACDVFVLPSFDEGWPTVFFEAMACGKPIVATNVGGSPEVIKSTDFGFLVPPGNSTALAEAIKKALAKKWDKSKILAYAGKHSWSEIAKRTFRVYEDVLKQD